MPELDETAIITGSSKGIGAAIAERLSRDGFSVVINYSSDAGAARALGDKIAAAGGRAICVKADVSDPAAVAALFDQATSAFGGVDVLVNNAGIMTLNPLAEFNDALFDQHVAINLKGVLNGLTMGRRCRSRSSIACDNSSCTASATPTCSNPEAPV